MVTSTQPFADTDPPDHCIATHDFATEAPSSLASKSTTSDSSHENHRTKSNPMRDGWEQPNPFTALHDQLEESLKNDRLQHDNFKHAAKNYAKEKMYNCHHRRSTMPAILSHAEASHPDPNIDISKDSLQRSTSHDHPRTRRHPCLLCAAKSPIWLAWATRRNDKAYRADEKRILADHRAEIDLLIEQERVLREMRVLGSSRRSSAVSGLSSGAGDKKEGGRLRRLSAVVGGAREEHRHVVLEACPPGVPPVRPLPEGKRMVLEEEEDGSGRPRRT